LSAGIDGNNTIRGRETDTFGLGYYYAGRSEVIGPLLEALWGPIGDGQGVELFATLPSRPGSA
jgi:porin